MNRDYAKKFFSEEESEINTSTREQKEIEVLYRTLSEDAYFRINRNDIIKNSMLLKDFKGNSLSIVIECNNEYSYMVLDHNRQIRGEGTVKSDDSSFCRLETLIERINTSSAVQIEIQESYFKVERDNTSIHNFEAELFILRTVKERISDAGKKLEQIKECGEHLSERDKADKNMLFGDDLSGAGDYARDLQASLASGHNIDAADVPGDRPSERDEKKFHLER